MTKRLLNLRWVEVLPKAFKRLRRDEDMLKVYYFGLFGLIGLIGLDVAPATAAANPQEPFQISQADQDKIPASFRRREVAYDGNEKPGTIIVDATNRYLYLILTDSKALRYGVGVGRAGFVWSGRAVIRRKAKWPKWTPPAEMVERDEEAAKWANGMPGGPNNPLGARALYLFQGNVDTLYRIHGTFQASSIGKAVSSGCIRLLNADVADLYERVPIGTTVVVLASNSTDKPAVEKLLQKKVILPKAKKAAPLVRRNFNLGLGS